MKHPRFGVATTTNIARTTTVTCPNWTVSYSVKCTWMIGVAQPHDEVMVSQPRWGCLEVGNDNKTLRFCNDIALETLCDAFVHLRKRYRADPQQTTPVHFNANRTPPVRCRSGRGAAPLRGADWPAFLGPNGDGRVDGYDVSADWKQNPPKSS